MAYTQLQVEAFLRKLHPGPAFRDVMLMCWATLDFPPQSFSCLYILIKEDNTVAYQEGFAFRGNTILSYCMEMNEKDFISLTKQYKQKVTKNFTRFAIMRL